MPALPRRHRRRPDHVGVRLPHTDTVWPESQSITEGVFRAASCSPEEIELISHGNAERVFDWTMADAALVVA